MLGDRLVDRFGQRAVARAGGLIIAAGHGGGAGVPERARGTIAGFAAAGFGVGHPGARPRCSAADELPGLRPGTGLTVLTWLMRVGFVFAPIVVGAIADAFSLRAGLLTVPVAGIVVIALAGVLAASRKR